MAKLDIALQQLREERTQAQLQVEKLDSAISVIEDLVGRNGSAPVRGARGGRTVSAIARRRMALAQRARWARVRKQSQVGTAARPAAKRTLSLAARRKIAAAQRARWARVKAQQSKKAA